MERGPTKVSSEVYTATKGIPVHRCICYSKNNMTLGLNGQRKKKRKKRKQPKKFRESFYLHT